MSALLLSVSSASDFRKTLPIPSPVFKSLGAEAGLARRTMSSLLKRELLPDVCPRLAFNLVHDDPLKTNRVGAIDAIRQNAGYR